MDLGLKGKIVVVAGGAKGIGAAIVRACAAEQAIPIIVDRDLDVGRALQAEVQHGNVQCGLITVDLAIADNCAKAVAQTIAAFGRINALVNGGISGDDVALEHGSAGEYFEMLNRKLVPCYSLAHDSLPYLKESRGSIVNVSSKQGSASCTGAVMALTREWAAELLPFGVRVNMVLAQAMGQGNIDEGILKNAAETQATMAEDVAAVVMFLLSAKSSHTTGQHLHVEGGGGRFGTEPA